METLESILQRNLINPYDAQLIMSYVTSLRQKLDETKDEKYDLLNQKIISDSENDTNKFRPRCESILSRIMSPINISEKLIKLSSDIKHEKDPVVLSKLFAEQNLTIMNYRIDSMIVKNITDFVCSNVSP